MVPGKLPEKKSSSGKQGSVGPPLIAPRLHPERTSQEGLLTALGGANSPATAEGVSYSHWGVMSGLGFAQVGVVGDAMLNFAYRYTKTPNRQALPGEIR